MDFKVVQWVQKIIQSELEKKHILYFSTKMAKQTVLVLQRAHFKCCASVSNEYFQFLESDSDHELELC